MVGEAVQQLRELTADDTEDNGYSVRRVIFKAPLALDEFRPVEVITTLRPVMLNDVVESDWYAFTITSHDGSGWTKNCSGQVRAGSSSLDFSISVAKEDCRRPVHSDRWYRAFADLGLPYRPSFRGLQDIHADPRGGSARATATNHVERGSRYTVHPTVIDQCLQLFAVAAAAGLPRRLGSGGAIPASFDSLVVAGPGTVKATAAARVVVLSLRGGHFFRLPGAGDSSLPLTTYIEWKPDINFQDPQSLLPGVSLSPEQDELVRLPGMLALLRILETSEMLQDTQPPASPPHLAKWKTWIMEEARKIATGAYWHLYPESADWARWTPSQRAHFLETVEQQAASLDEGITAVIRCLRLICSNCVGITQGTTSVLDLLLEDDLLADFYASSLRLVDWDRFPSLLCHSNPLLRVLEIGAGTGSATAHALRSLIVNEANAENMDVSQPLAIEIDSLMGIEVRNWSRRNLGIEVGLLEISQAKTVGGLARVAMERLRGKYLGSTD